MGRVVEDRCDQCNKVRTLNETPDWWITIRNGMGEGIKIIPFTDSDAVQSAMMFCSWAHFIEKLTPFATP